MPRNALPQNYYVNQGVQLVDFEGTTGWAGGAIAADTQHFITGTSSLQMTTPSGGNTYSDRSVSWFLNENGCFQLSVYLPDDSANINSIDVLLSSKSDFSVYFTFSFFDHLNPGWNLLTFHKNEFSNVGGDDWNNKMVKVRLRVNANAAKVATVSFDDLRYKVEMLPRIVITFDDGYDTAYNEGILYMNSKGLRGTMFVISSLVGNAGYMTKAQFDDAYANGWALGNHTREHKNLSTLTPADAEDQLKSCTNWLNSQGYVRASNHVAYPFGGYNADTFQAMTKSGMKTGRTTWGGFHLTPPTLDPYQLTTLNVTNTSTLNGLKQRIDHAMKYNVSVNLLFHQLVASPTTATEWAKTDFQTLIDYIAERKAPCVTIDEWYNGLTNPRYSSLPIERIVV